MVLDSKKDTKDTNEDTAKTVETKEDKQIKAIRGTITPKIYRDGPTTYRGCTDFCCLLLFFLFWGGLVAIAHYALVNGDPEPYTYPFDQLGNQCTGNYSKLFFIRSGRNFSASNTVCIYECPDASATDVDCEPDFTDCPAQVYATMELNDLFCVPTKKDYYEALNNVSALDFGFMFEAMSDVQQTLWTNIVIGVVAIVLSYIYMVLLKHFSGLLVWGLLTTFIILLALFGLICLDDAQGTFNLSDITPDDISSLDPQYLTMIAYGCFALAFIALILVCIYRQKIRLSLTILQAATDFLDDHPGLLLLPILFFICTVAFYTGWLYLIQNVIGLNTFGPNDDNTPGGEVEWEPANLAMFVYYIFAVFWNHAFGVALMQFIVASTTCFWYFRKGKAHIGESFICKSIGRAFLHLGSIIFGSVAHGLFGWLKVLTNSGNNIDPELDQIDEGCCGAFKYVNRHSYIQLAMRGDPFFKCTKEAYYLILRGKDRFGAVYGLAWTFLTLGEIFISVCTTFIGYIWITQSDKFSENLYSPIAPSIFYFLISWTISRIFMSIYGTSSDTIVHCFAMDEEMNEGISEHAPKRLRDFVDDNLHKKLLITSD